MVKSTNYDKVYLIAFIIILSIVTVGVCLLSNRLLVTTDIQRYAVLANNIVSGRGYTLGGEPEVIFPPGYPLFLVPLLFIGINIQSSVSLLIGLSIALLGIALYFLAKSVGGVRTGFLAATLLVINGNILLWSSIGYIEILWLAMLLVSFYLFLKEKPIYLTSGLFASAAYILKPESLAYILLFLIAHTLYIKEIDTKKIIKYLTPVIIVALAYSLFITVNTGKFAISGKVATLEWDSFVENDQVLREEVVYSLNEDYSVGKTISNMNINNIDITKRVALNVVSLKQGMYELLLPFVFVILVMTTIFVVHKKFRKGMILSGIILIPVFIPLLFHIERRYLIILLVYVIYWLSRATIKGIETRDSKKMIATSGISIVALALLTYYSYYPLRAEIPDLIQDNSKIVDYIDSINVENDLILSRKPVYSYYLSKDYYPLPWINDENKLMEYLAKYSDASILLDKWSEATIPLTDSTIKKLDEQGEITQQAVIIKEQ